LILGNHARYTLRHLRRQLIVTEVEREEALQAHDCVDDVLGLAVRHLEFFHLEVLDAAGGVAEKSLQKVDFFFLNRNAIYTYSQQRGIPGNRTN
jgi:hypothetical protein